MPTPFTIGLNCALGAKEMRAHIAEIARIADTLHLRLSQCRPPQRIRPLRRESRIHGGAARGIRGCRHRQRGRRLLRHHARAYPCNRARGRRQGAANNSRRSSLLAPVRSRSLHAHAGNPVRQCRRAHQRHRLGQVPQARHRRRLRCSARHRARSGRERRADHRRQHGRGPARFREGDDHLSQPDRGRARHRPRPGHGRLLEILGDRGRAQMPAG